MKVFRMLAFAVLGALVSAVSGIMGSAAGPRAGRQPIDWSAVSLESIGGGPLPTGSYKGQVVLLVNTASLCGFTGQYRGLEALWRKYKDKGLGRAGRAVQRLRRPGARLQRRDQALLRSLSFDVTFPLADKQAVIGPDAHPLYRWAAVQTGPLGTPSWNFHKILIGRDGRVIDWFTAMSGVGPKLDSAIEAALARQ